MAGIIVLWSGDRPRYGTMAIPAGGLRLGRDLLGPDDIEISRAHVELFAEGERLVVRDLGSRNGCLVNGEHVIDRRELEVEFPAVLRCGRTICLAVPDLAHYTGVAPARRGRAVVAGALAETCRALDACARAEEHVALLGPISLGRELARSYATTVGGDHIVVELDVMTSLPLERSIDRARSPRTMILVLDRPLTLPDQPELEQWLETDIRIVSVARCLDSFKYMPKQLVARLMPTTLELPQVRLDELPATIFELVDARAPEAKIHASLIEVVLLRASMGEERLLRYLDGAIDHWRARSLAIYQGRDLEDYIEADGRMRNCVVGALP